MINLHHASKNLLGQKFNRLTVVALIENTSQGLLWKCECECGKFRNVVTCRLTNGRVKSCGCYRLEKLIERNKKNPSRSLDPGVAALNNLIYRYERRASIIGLEFILNRDDVYSLIISNCFYCSILPYKDIHTGNNTSTTFKANGIDRVDSDTGYVKYNCVSCCENCNYAKNDMTIYEWCSYVELFKPGFTQETMKKLKKAGIRISKSS